MAQLPPRPPTTYDNILHKHLNNWQDVNPQQPPQLPIEHPPLVALPPSAINHNGIIEFEEFSAARRKAHRRSIRDSVSFIETCLLSDDCQTEDPLLQDQVSCCGGGNNGDADKGRDGDGFERFNEDDQLIMSMLSNELVAEIAPGRPTTLIPSRSTCGHSTVVSTLLNAAEQCAEDEEEKAAVKSENEEVVENPSSKESSPQPQQDGPMPSSETLCDLKRVKRILANRQSAQRSRVRKLHYISELERSVTSLQTEVSMLTPRVAYLDNQRMILSVDNSALKGKIAALAQDKIFKDAHQEALKREIERLKQTYYRMSLRAANNGTTDTPASQPPYCDILTMEQLTN